MRVSAKKILSILPLPIIILIIIWHYHFVSFTPDVSSAIVQQRTDKELLNNPTVLTAYKNRLSKLQVKGQGTIIKLLKDDLEGSRHQRILLKVNPGQTLLIAHNIDLASRIADLSVGETLEFYGNIFGIIRAE